MIKSLTDPSRGWPRTPPGPKRYGLLFRSVSTPFGVFGIVLRQQYIVHHTLVVGENPLEFLPQIINCGPVPRLKLPGQSGYALPNVVPATIFALKALGMIIRTSLRTKHSSEVLSASSMRHRYRPPVLNAVDARATPKRPDPLDSLGDRADFYVIQEFAQPALR